MSDRPEMLDKLELEKQLREMPNVESKVDFFIWEVWYMRQDIADIKGNCVMCDNSGKKQKAFNWTSVGSAIGLICLGIYEFFSRR